jgi:hypothetical protein
MRRDLPGSGTAGAVVTTREDGPDHSRLGGLDLRLYHSKLYYVELQAAQSWTRQAASDRSGPLLQAVWDRTGRGWGFHYMVQAVSPEFDAAAGFVNRAGILNVQTFNRLSFYGKPGALVQTYGSFIGVGRIWEYSDLGNGPIEGGEFISPSATIRGGWQLGGSLSRNFFTYEPSPYAGLTVETGTGTGLDTIPFAVPGREGNQWGGSLRLTTPTYRQFTATASISAGRVPIFREAAPGRSVRLDGSVDLRPTASLRATLQFSRLALTRRRDGSRYSTETIPRIKVEYQVNRSLFVRVVGQYDALTSAALVDRQGRPILVGGVKDQGRRSNEFRMDWLFSYRPAPGTLLYFGYGSTMQEPRQFRFGDLSRTTDGFFGKVSYVFRM